MQRRLAVPIRTLIADDEPLVRGRIRDLLAEEPDFLVVGECATGRAALSAIGQLNPELVFLDVQLPELDGFELLDRLDGARRPAIVFVAAHDQYALRAFEVHALDYLMKPFDRERFNKALERARREILQAKNRDLSERLLSLIKDLGSEKPRVERLVVKSAGRIRFLKTEEINWIEAAGNYVRLRIADETHLLRETMAGIESKLDPQKFIRIHRSTIVNLERVKEIYPKLYGEYVVALRDGTQLTMSRGYREKLAELQARAS
jgi:two-component system LytT family response regulator